MTDKLYEWCVARLNDAREDAEIDEDVSDAVIEREAFKLESAIHDFVSSFVGNEFDKYDDEPTDDQIYNRFGVEGGIPYKTDFEQSPDPDWMND